MDGRMSCCSSVWRRCVRAVSWHFGQWMLRVLDQVKYAITWMLCDENAEFSCGRWDVMLQALYGEHWQY